MARALFVAVALTAGCASTSRDGLRPLDRSPTVYWRVLIGQGVPLEHALSHWDGDLQRFVRQEALAIRAGVARGEGPVLSDLAHVLGLSTERTDELVSLLRSHRESLDRPLSEGTMDEERVRQFSRALRAALAPLMPAGQGNEIERPPR